MMRPEDEKIKQVVREFLTDPESPVKILLLTDLIQEYPDNEALREKLLQMISPDKDERERAISIALNNPNFLNYKLVKKNNI